MLTAILAALGFLLEGTLIVRAAKGGFLSRFPFFFSYITFIFVGTAGSLMIYYLFPAYHRNYFWIYFLIGLLAEFAVLIEASDHIFRPFPAIRQLGRFLVLFTASIFFSAYILPSVLARAAGGPSMFSLVKTASVAKGLIIIALLVAANAYRLPLGKNIAGMLLGFAAYLGINIANFALGETYGKALYGATFGIVGPVSWNICSLIWTIALWKYEPVAVTDRMGNKAQVGMSAPLTYRLDRFDATLMRILRK